jgi:prepilin peptidase CpaA
MVPVVPAAAALTIATAACVTDVAWRRIPNALTLGGAAVGLAVAAVLGGWPATLAALAGWSVGLAVFLPIFLLGGLGAGDIKLLAAFGAWIGPGEVIWVALYGAIAGGVFAIALALARGYLRTALRNVYMLLTHWRVAGVGPVAGLTLEGSSGPRLAYALPMAAGLVLTLWLRR